MMHHEGALGQYRARALADDGASMSSRHLLAKLLHPVAQVGHFFKVQLLGSLLHLGLELID